MPNDERTGALLAEPSRLGAEESQSLLSESYGERQEDLVVQPGPGPSPSSDSHPTQFPIIDSAQPSISQPTPDGQRRPPRTTNRVRFDIEDEHENDEDDGSQDNRRSSSITRGSQDLWLEEEDYESAIGDPPASGSRGITIPLLTNIEAPSVTLATSGDFFPEEYLEDARPRNGMRMAFMNMANSIIGAGIIGQPYALRQAGVMMGIILLVVLTITVDWTIRLIVVNSKMSGADSFQATMHHCFGKSGLVAISIAQWVFAFGGMVAFCIIVGDTIPRVLGALIPPLRDMPFLWLLTDRRAIIVIFVLGVSYPLSLYRDIAKVRFTRGGGSLNLQKLMVYILQLAKASTFALISMLVIVIAVITQGFRVPSESRGDVKNLLLANSGFFQSVGVISFAFVCHHNSLLIYGSLKKPTLDRFAKVTHYSAGVSLAMCLAMGLAGFLAFGSKTQGNVLNNFPSDNVLVNIARLCFGLNMLTTLPLEAFVCRSVMTTFYFPDEPFHPNRHLMFTTALVLTAMALALVTCDLGSVFELIGATSAASLAYIFPPLCYVRLSQSSRTAKIPAFLCIAFGFVVMGVSILQAVAKTIRNEGEVRSCSVT